MASRFAALDLFRRIDITKVAGWLRRTSSTLVLGSRWGDRRLAALTMLSPHEKALLQEFLERNTRTIYVPTSDGAFGLELAEILSIHREPERAANGTAFALGIHAWAWEHLRRHPELLAGGAPLTVGPSAI